MTLQERAERTLADSRIFLSAAAAPHHNPMAVIFETDYYPSPSDTLYSIPGSTLNTKNNIMMLYSEEELTMVKLCATEHINIIVSIDDVNTVLGFLSTFSLNNDDDNEEFRARLEEISNSVIEEFINDPWQLIAGFLGNKEV